jgi:hypothetical protein
MASLAALFFFEAHPLVVWRRQREVPWTAIAPHMHARFLTSASYAVSRPTATRKKTAARKTAAKRKTAARKTAAKKR